MIDNLSDEEADLLQQVSRRIESGKPTTTKLRTDERVLARISDGIYREPASALRELIANAYDADATRVTIETDVPRFETLTVRDNGVGMSKELLVHMINHIGGSTKRQAAGAGYGVTKEGDPKVSRGGRRLIGKIGIGLFSVSQLCRRFRIITKRKGDAFRLVAEVSLLRYDEEIPEAADGKVDAGTVTIRSMPATDLSAQGTDIILTPLSPPARDLLRSRDIWDRVADGGEAMPDADTFAPPTYHVGKTDKAGETLVRTSELPWNGNDPPAVRFKKLHDAVLAETAARNAKPRLDTTLDRYLRTLWFLSLAAPLDYLDGKHPFDLTGAEMPTVHVLSNAQKGSADERIIPKTKTIREELGLHAPERPGNRLDRFEVFVDNVKLFRPLSFDGGPAADRQNPVRTPLLFVGRFAPDLSPIPAEQRGGSLLEFESYLLWTPRVVPTDHNGLMVRIADASGTLFDHTFLGYQVAETTRLSQISGEVFTLNGLDGALNIDRESFNFGHPHAKILASWVHRALRQVATTHKRVGKASRDARRDRDRKAAQDQADKIVERVSIALDLDERPQVELRDDEAEVRKLRREGVAAFSRTAIWGEDGPTRRGLGTREHERKMEAALRVLAAYGVLDRLSYAQQQDLVRALSEIFLGADQ